VTSWTSSQLHSLFGHSANDWLIDEEGIIIKKQSSSEPVVISFPSSSYDENQVALNSWWVRARSTLILKHFTEHHISSLLEIGSGNGYVSIPLSAAGVNVIGLEPLRMGALTLTRNRVPTIQATFEDLKLERNSCPAIGAFDVIEHIEDDQ